MTTQHLQTYCAMCISRCGVVATVEDGLFQKVTADPAHPNGCICVKGTAAPEMVYAPDRMHYPMQRTRPKGEADPGWVCISWDEAMELTASRLLDIKARYGAEAVVFGIETPAGTATADYWDWLLRLANAFGSPNFTDPIYQATERRSNHATLHPSQYQYAVRDLGVGRCLADGHGPGCGASGAATVQSAAGQ